MKVSTGLFLCRTCTRIFEDWVPAVAVDEMEAGWACSRDILRLELNQYSELIDQGIYRFQYGRFYGQG